MPRPAQEPIQSTSLPADLYRRITSFASLHAAALKAQRGKRRRPAVLAFHERLEANLFQLQQELESFAYAPGPYRRFVIRDPKRRLISAAPYRDRVVHHALCAAIAPPLERGFIATSYANRQGFGSHKALRRFVAECGKHRWLLSADIQLYFPSIDLTILRAQLAERIPCLGTLWLLDRILANLHLDAIDHRLAALPVISAHLRYVDDVVLFAHSPAPLRAARLVLEPELAALRLRLHPIKSQIHQTRHGACFVGFLVRPGRVRVRNHNLLKGKRRLPLHCRGVASGVIPWRRRVTACGAGMPTSRTATPGASGGGSWNNHPRNCRSAYRNRNHPDNRDNNRGFRVCCLPQHPSTSEPV
jgi:hypothetical protein